EFLGRETVTHACADEILILRSGGGGLGLLGEFVASRDLADAVDQHVATDVPIDHATNSGVQVLRGGLAIFGDYDETGLAASCSLNELCQIGHETRGEDHDGSAEFFERHHHLFYRLSLGDHAQI